MNVEIARAQRQMNCKVERARRQPETTVRQGGKTDLKPLKTTQVALHRVLERRDGQLGQLVLVA